jgi:hypothetical protein
VSLKTLIFGSVVEEHGVPAAVISVEPAFAVVGSVIKLDGRRSTDPFNADLTYAWSFVSTPIGSRVATEGFRKLDTDGSLVSFSPDLVGEYVIGLTVSNGVYESALSQAATTVRAMLVPHAQGLVPDGKFIWSYIRDVWSEIENREVFETLWSALVQIVGADLLKLYQVDFNKSIRDVQDTFQRRWLSYEPKLSLSQDDLHFYLGYHVAGSDAFTVEGDGSVLTDTVSIPASHGVSQSVLAPGRVIVVGGQTFRVVRSVIDNSTGDPMTRITLDGTIAAGSTALNWRIPHTLVSSTQDFDASGVAPGDVLLVDVVHEASQSAVEIPVQVIGVSGSSLGFVLTDGDTSPGLVPALPSKFLSKLADGFGLTQVVDGVNGDIFLSGLAKRMFDEAASIKFQRTYWNIDLTTSSSISVGDLSFFLKPKTILRNSKIPVDETLKSVPLLQEYVAQPTVSEANGKLTIVSKDGFEKEVPRRPVVLTENIDYIIDGDFAIDGMLTFTSGSNIVESDQGDFLDRGVRPGDSFTIDDPITLVGEYFITSVDSARRITLNRPVPLYVLGELVTAKVRLKRKKGGTFLRFTPGTFKASLPAPARLWSEVSFFDNGENIENNFGVLVGLKREDLHAVTTNINYRQAVAGMMFAFTKGSAIEKVRLGAQILLGLPFAEHRGVIRSIENDYRLDAAGKPSLGRLLIEDVDRDGAPEGVLRVYTFPIDEASSLAGVETNPATGVAYRVGDTVELFSALAKGVEISDYKNTPFDSSTSIEKILQRYHSIQLVANDSIFSVDEIGLVSSFLRKITPSYIAFYISMATEVSDSAAITDKVFGKALFSNGTFSDTVSSGFAPAAMLDSRSPNSIPQGTLGDQLLSIRRSGSDLVLTNGSQTAHVTAGGLLNPRTGESFEAPLVRAGDILAITGGSAQGHYLIQSVTNTDITLVAPPAYGFESETVRYVIYRMVDATLQIGANAAITSGSPIVTMPSGALRTDGASPDDWLLDVTNGKRFTIQSVGTGQVTLLETPNYSGTVSYRIVRWKHLVRPLPETFTVVGNSSNVLSIPPTLKAYSEIGDELEDQDTRLRYTLLDPPTGKLNTPFPSSLLGPAADASARAYWRLDEESGGAVAVDSVGTYPLSTVSGSPTVVTGKFNKGRYFGGTSHLEGSADAATTTLITSGNYTIRFWLKPDAYPGGAYRNYGLFMFGDVSRTEATSRLYIKLWENTGMLYLGSGLNGNTNLSNSNVSALSAAWHHFAAVFTWTGGSSFTVQLYIDSVLDRTVVGWNQYVGGSIPNPTWFIGAGWDGSAFSNGFVAFDEVEVINRAWSSSDVASDFANTGQTLSQTVKLYKKRARLAAFGLDHRTIEDPLAITLKGTGAVSTTGSAEVTLSPFDPVAANILPGDTLRLLTGSNAGEYAIAVPKSLTPPLPNQSHWDCNEASGNLLDSVRGFTLTASGSPTGDGSRRTFNGTSQYFMGNMPQWMKDVLCAGEYRLDMDVNFDVANANTFDHNLLCIGSRASGDTFLVVHVSKNVWSGNNHLEFSFEWNNNSMQTIGSYTVPTGTSLALSFIVTGSGPTWTFTLQVNGVTQGTFTGNAPGSSLLTHSLSDLRFTIGADTRYNGASFMFAGTIGDIVFQSNTPTVGPKVVTLVSSLGYSETSGWEITRRSG